MNNRQVSVTIQKDDNGTAGKLVLCNGNPTIGNELNSFTIYPLMDMILHVTIVG